ncbi:uncharacterized protein LOC116213229 isoform X3 [Punica granatum]|uniref:Uncharacterized protein LOC116213229 isoform X3 n=1 Tax=Punica granatum TaxID=22663 RepID=A0A6P8EBQ0_PUNGR|nr:uncharacterized protein LOC116213229 isoform X3 [Punica granatum]
MANFPTPSNRSAATHSYVWKGKQWCQETFEAADSLIFRGALGSSNPAQAHCKSSLSDATWRDSKAAAIVGIAKPLNGDICCSWFAHITAASPTHAEAQAILIAVSLALNHN